MPITDLFRKKSRVEPRILIDPYFGSVELNKGHWIGKINFPPIQRQIDFALAAGDEGPKEDQRDFFRRIVENYSYLREQHRSFFLSNYGSSPDKPSPDELFNSLELQFIYLPAIIDGPRIWEMTYTTNLEDHLIIPRFTDMTFLDEGWDG